MLRTDELGWTTGNITSVLDSDFERTKRSSLSLISTLGEDFDRFWETLSSSTPGLPIMVTHTTQNQSGKGGAVLPTAYKAFLPKLIAQCNRQVQRQTSFYVIPGLIWATEHHPIMTPVSYLHSYLFIDFRKPRKWLTGLERNPILLQKIHSLYLKYPTIFNHKQSITLVAILLQFQI